MNEIISRQELLRLLLAIGIYSLAKLINYVNNENMERQRGK